MNYLDILPVETGLKYSGSKCLLTPIIIEINSLKSEAYSNYVLKSGFNESFIDSNEYYNLYLAYLGSESILLGALNLSRNIDYV